MRLAASMRARFLAFVASCARPAVFLSLGAFCVSALPQSALAQGCALCYTSAASTSPAAQRSLDLGILVLLIPTLLMFVGIVVFAVRRAAAPN